MSANHIPSPNARVSAVAIIVGASIQLTASMLGQLAAPWAFLGWLIFVFGSIGLCQELGASRPLNRAGLLFMGAAFCARTVMVVSPGTGTEIRTQLMSAFASLAAILFWSLALMHRSDRPRMVGAFGVILSGSALLLLLTAHVVVGAITMLGFSDIFSALHDPGKSTRRAMETVAVILGMWSLVIAFLLWTRNLSPAPGDSSTALRSG